MTSVPHRVLVVGAGFAGLAAVRALPDTTGFDITIVDRRNHHLFQALLYQVASAGLNPSEIASPVRAIFRNRRNVRVLMAEMTGLKEKEKKAVFDQGELELPYDSLVLAVGGQTSYFGHDAWRRHSFGLKSIEEALAIRERVLLAFEEAEKSTDSERRRELMTIVVIGGGPTGVELSGAFAELARNVLKWDFRSIDPADTRVILLEGGSRILQVFPEELSEAARQDLEALGVEVRLDESVLDLTEGLVTTSRGEIKAHTVIWAGGVAGHPLAETLGFATNGRGQIKVDPSLRVPGSDIFCLGDMAELICDGEALPAMAPVAMQQGEHCGKNVLLLSRHQPLEPFVYRDPGIMATVGRTRGVALLGGRQYTGTRGWFTWLWHHLLRIVDLQNRIFVLARWSWAYVSWKWGVRLVYDRLPEREALETTQPIPKEER